MDKENVSPGIKMKESEEPLRAEETGFGTLSRCDRRRLMEEQQATIKKLSQKIDQLKVSSSEMRQNLNQIRTDFQDLDSKVQEASRDMKHVSEICRQVGEEIEIGRFMDVVIGRLQHCGNNIKLLPYSLEENGFILDNNDREYEHNP